MFWKVFSLSAEEFEQSLRMFVFQFLVFIVVIIFLMTVILPFM